MEISVRSWLRDGTYSVFIAVIAVSSVIALVSYGYLSSPVAITSAWLAAFVLVGAFSIRSFWDDTSMLKELLHEYEPVYATFDRIRDIDGPVVKKRCLEEISKIRLNTKEVREVLCRPQFQECVSHWDSSDSIATFQALDSLHTLFKEYLSPHRDLTFQLKRAFLDNDNILKSINDRFDKTEGCWYANRESRYPTIVASYATIKTAQNLLLNQGRKPTLRRLNSLLGEDKVDGFRALLDRCLVKDTGGFRDIGEKEPSVGTTEMVVRIVSILEGDLTGKALSRKLENMFTFEKVARPWDFIMRCWRSADIDGNQAGGFGDAFERNNPWVCSTFFAVNCLESLGKMELVANKETLLYLSNFLIKCKKQEPSPEGGQTTVSFSANPYFGSGDIMHTNYALRLTKLLFPEHLRSEDVEFYSGLISFLNSCKKESGYAFRPGWEPNLMATCWARNIDRTIKGFSRQKIPQVFKPIETVKFVISCYVEKDAAFTGYPLEDYILEAA